MSNLSNVLTKFTEDIKALEKVKKEKETCKKSYDQLKIKINALKDAEIKQQGKDQAIKNIENLKLKQNAFNNKNNQYADAVLLIQSDFQETYSTVLHSLVDTVYDARKMMHYLASAKDHNDSDFKADHKAIEGYLKAYTDVNFDIKSLNQLIKKAEDLSKYLNYNDRRTLMSAFSKHAKDDLENLKTFIEKKNDLEKILKEINLNESIEKLPTTDEIITNYAFLIPTLFDKKAGEEVSMSDALKLPFTALFSKEIEKAENKVEKKVEFEYKQDITIVIPLYADPIITVSFDFKFDFEFKTSASLVLETNIITSTISLKATCSLSFGVSIALSLRIVQLIKASINLGIYLDTSATAEAKLEAQMVCFSGTTELKAESKLIAKTWISLSICGPVSIIIKAAIGKDPELRWLLGELVLFKLSMDKKAELTLDPDGNKFKTQSNFRPLKDGFKVEFVGKDEIKRKLNERYNNKLSLIKQQFLSDDEMKAAHDDKVKLLAKFDVLDFDAGNEENNNFKNKIKNRSNFIMNYESDFNNFLGEIIRELDPQLEKLEKTSTFINSYTTELKKKYHALFLEENKPEGNIKIEDYFDDQGGFKEMKEDIWTKSRSSSKAKATPKLIEMLKKALTRIKSNQEYATKLFALEMIDLEYMDKHSDIKFKEISKLIDKSKKEAEAFIEKLVIGDIGKGSCVFGFSSTELFSSPRKQRKEAIAELKSNIEDYIKKEKSAILELKNPAKEINSNLIKDAIALKTKFDKRKKIEVEQEKDFHKYLKDKDEKVIEYFQRISGDLNLQKLDPIKKGTEKLQDFHEKNKKQQDYLSLLSKTEITGIYEGNKTFGSLVTVKLNEEYKNQIKILNGWKVKYDVYELFNKDKQHLELNNFMTNVLALHNFVTKNKTVKLEETHFYGDVTYKTYLKKDPKEMLEMLNKKLKKATS